MTFVFRVARVLHRKPPLQSWGCTGRMVLCDIKNLKRLEKYSRNEFIKQLELEIPDIVVKSLDIGF